MRYTVYTGYGERVADYDNRSDAMAHAYTVNGYVMVGYVPIANFADIEIETEVA